MERFKTQMSNQTDSVVGYVAAFLESTTTTQLTRWAEKSLVKSKLFVRQQPGEKQEGGIVTTKAHVTLFFGLNEKIINHQQLTDYLNNLQLKPITVKSWGLFATPEPRCQILHLLLDDEDGVLTRIHETLAQFPHYPQLKQRFTPHLTVAYVTSDYNLSELPPPPIEKIKFDRIEYRLYSKSNRLP